jgi:hypothetical protein
MFVLPDATPVTIPVAEPIDAIDGLPLVQKPPGTELVRPIVLPTQTVAEDGVIVAGVTLTVIVFTAAQPKELV